MKKPPNPSKTDIIMPTAKEDEAISRGIAQDPDTVELTAELAARLQLLRRRGRPAVERTKELMTMRVDADVLAAIKATGAGWQTRVNALLRKAVREGKLAH